MDQLLLHRAFGLLGPVEALVEMAAFSAWLAAAGWRPGGGDAELGGACGGLRGGLRHRGAGPDGERIRIPRREPRPRALGWTTNRFLLVAVAVESLQLAGFLTSDPWQPFLAPAHPPPIGIMLAALSMPAVVAADTIRGQLTARPRDTAQPVPTCAWAVDIR